MPDLQLTLEAEPDRLDGLRVWIVRGTVAAGFLVIGAKKFDEASIWVKLFAQLGAGDWLRDVTGGLQISVRYCFWSRGPHASARQFWPAR